MSAELCNESIDSLRRVYKHFKVMLLFMVHIMRCVYVVHFSSLCCFLQRVVKRSQLKSSVLAVKAENLQDVHSLKQELLEKDAVIAELKRQLANSQVGGSSGGQNEELTRCQREYPEYFCV